MLEKIIRMLSEYTDVPADQINASSDFVLDLHIDSVDMVAMVMTLEDEFGVQIPDDKLGDLHTVGDVVRLLESLCPPIPPPPARRLPPP